MSHSHLFLRKALALAFVPVICLQNWVFTGIPNYYLQHWFIYLATIFLLLYWKTGDFKILAFCRKYGKVFAVLSVVTAFQAVSLSISVQEAYTGSFWSNYAIHLIKLFAQFPFLVAIIALYDLLVRDTEIHRHIFYGFVFSLLFTITICFIQIFCIICTKIAFPYFQEMNRFLQTIIINAASLLEARWNNNIYDFYFNGSYTTTLIRVNGIFEEASALAANISTFSLPICLGLILSPKARTRKTGFAACLALITISVASVSLTGIILAGTATLLLLFYAALSGMRMRRMGVSLCLMALVLAALSASPYHRTMFFHCISKLTDMANPRLVITQKSAEMAAENPVLGVGRGMFSFYLEERIAPLPVADTDPEFIEWRKRGSIPQLSSILGVAAEYGIILVLGLSGIITYIGRALHRFTLLSPASASWKVITATYLAWCVLAFSASFGSIDWRNAMFNSVFFAAIAILHNLPYPKTPSACE